VQRSVIISTKNGRAKCFRLLDTNTCGGCVLSKYKMFKLIKIQRTDQYKIFCLMDLEFQPLLLYIEGAQ